MDGYKLTAEAISNYGRYLQLEEKSAATVQKYVRDAACFALWLDGRVVTKAETTAWKDHLVAQHYAPVTINAMLSALNGLFRFLGWEGCRVKFLKVQRQVFRDERRELDRSEYTRLLAAARALGQERLGLLMESICAAGIRVSEIQYITVEAVQRRQAQISLKGKVRTILIPDKLAYKLLKYAKKQQITSGMIFLTRGGKPLSRRQVWAEMKALCKAAGVAPSKVFPHNLRHLFATTFYRACRDIVRLADVLGHSSIETTRIYLLTSGADHRRQLEQLGLIS